MTTGIPAVGNYPREDHVEGNPASPACGATSFSVRRPRLLAIVRGSSGLCHGEKVWRRRFPYPSTITSIRFRTDVDEHDGGVPSRCEAPRDCLLTPDPEGCLLSQSPRLTSSPRIPFRPQQYILASVILSAVFYVVYLAAYQVGTEHHTRNIG